MTHKASVELRELFGARGYVLGGDKVLDVLAEDVVCFDSLTALKRDPFSGLLLFMVLSGFVRHLPQALLRFNSGLAAWVLLRVLVVA